MKQKTSSNNQIATQNYSKTNAGCSGHIHKNIPLSPSNNKLPNKQKIRIVSPVARVQDDLESHDMYMKSQDNYLQNLNGTTTNPAMLTSMYQRFNESPEILQDYTSHYTNNNNNNKNSISSNQSTLVKQQQIQYLQQLQTLQQTQISMYQSQRNDTIDNKANIQMKGKKIDEQQQNLIINPKYQDTLLQEYDNNIIDDDTNYQNLHQQYNCQTIFHEKAKSLNSHQFQKQASENSGNKKQGLLSPQQLQQLSPNKMKVLLQMTNLIKNSSKEQFADPQTISPSSNNPQKTLKTRRKKSQGKININFQNQNAEDVITKTQQNNSNNLRSSSQPQQVRSQSQQANSQERGTVLQVKKSSIKNAESNQFQVKQEPLRIAQMENSVERIGPQNLNLNKQGNLKILLKKNSSVKQLPNQQAIKIQKDQIMLKNQQNYNSQGSIQQAQQNNLRSRSLSNNKFAKKKASPQSNIMQIDSNQIQQEDQLNTQRGSSKDKNIIGNSFNQTINIVNKQRCKSTNKAQGSSPQDEGQQVITQTQAIPMQNSSKVLMFKTNNEESNAKVAALKSLIKLSSNSNTNNYMQSKQVPQRNQSKENQQNLSQNQIQPGIQMKQLVQKVKLQDHANQGQFVQKCASANQNPNKPAQQQAQYMQRITSGRVVNQQSLNYHNQLKNTQKEALSNNTQSEMKAQVIQKEATLQNQIKINITQNSMKDMISQDNKDQSSSMKIASGQINIRNIKVNSSQQQQQKINTDQENVASLASISTTNKAQIAHQQKMHQILMNQQNKNLNQQLSTTNIVKTAISRNGFNAASTLEGSGSSLNNKRQSAGGVDLITKNLIQQNNGVNSNESFRGTESNHKTIKEQFSRKNSTLSNGSIQTQMQTNQKDLMQSMNMKTDLKTVKNQSKDILSRLQNTSQITYNTNFQESAQRKERILKQSERQTLFSETNTQNYHHQQNQFSDDKNQSGGKKLNFYNQLSPSSEVLSQFKDSQMISAFKNHDDDQDDASCCIAEDESMVIIQEDQLRLPLRSSKQSQRTQGSQQFLFDEEILSRQDTKTPHQLQEEYSQQPTKEDMVLQSIESDRSVFKKKHEISVVEQESLVTQIKTQLMKIHFQQAFQNDGSKTKRQRNQQNKDCHTMREGVGRSKFNVDLDNSSKQSIQQSGTFYFEPQFDDISFELDTCNQIRVPKNMNNPINEAKIMSLPEDLQIYQEYVDPQTGKVKFTVDQKTVTILNQNIKKANLLKVENQIFKQSVTQFPDPLLGKLKQDYETNIEERKEDEKIRKELETTYHAITNPQNNQLTNNDQSLSFQHSLCSSNNHSLNTFLSEDVSLNSHMISQVMNATNGNQVAAGIMYYAAEKLNVREGDPLFLLPRLNDKDCLKLKPALLKREPEWWLGHELSLFGGGSKRNEHEPVLETFMF